MQRGFASTVVLVIILAVLAGAAGYFVFYKNSSTSLAQTVPTAVTQASNEPKSIIPIVAVPSVATASQQPSSSTLTSLPYSNQAGGFSLESISGLSVKEESEGEYFKRIIQDMRKNFAGYVGYAPAPMITSVYFMDKADDYDSSPLTVWVFNNPNNLTIEQFYNKYWYYPFVWGNFVSSEKNASAPTNPETVDGKTGGSTVIDYRPGKPKAIYVAHGDKMYLIRVIGDEGILKNFKFL